MMFQRSDWSITVPFHSDHEQVLNTTDSEHAFSNQVSPADISQTRLQSSTKASPTLQSKLSQWFLSLSPITLGLLSGLLLGSIILAILLPLWLTTSAKKTAMVANPSTSTMNTMVSQTTTTAPTIIMLNQFNDMILGVYNTNAGYSTGASGGIYSGASEMPPYAMDNSTATKYLNFGSGGPGYTVYGPGIGTGFIVTPVISNASIACGLLFATAGDSPNRDPTSVTLEGSNAATSLALNSGSSWTLLYSGTTGISSTVDPGRNTYGNQQNFSNTVRYASYRLLITSQRGSDSSVQYSEARIIGYI